MMYRADKGLDRDAADNRLAEATDWFMRMRADDAKVEDLTGLQQWLEQDPTNGLAYRKVSATWDALERHASAPEIVIGRRDALEDARRAASARWEAFEPNTSRRRFALAAAIAGIAIAVGVWTFTRPPVYTTAIGERRTLTLEDGSSITLDASSRIQVDYRDNERLIALQQGQARFDVAKDPTRPFRVKARDQTVVALGTQFNVEIVGGNVLVTMIEGHVAVSKRESPVVELMAGEGLRVRKGGQATRIAKVDVERATAWQTGKMFFGNEPLATAAERINRYAHQQIQVDPSVASLSISGVFNTGDTDAFIEAVTTYFPVKSEHPDESTIVLSAR